MKYPRLIGLMNRIAGLISGGLILFIGILSVIEVVMRLVYKPTIWTMDISQYTLIWSIFLGSAYSLQEKGHVAVDFFREFVKKRSERIARALAVLGFVLSAAVIVVLLICGVRMSQQAVAFNKLTASMTQIPQVYLTAAIIVGALLMLITALCIIADLLGGGDNYL